MESGVFKSLLANLLLPPTGLMLLALLGVLMATRRQRGALALIFFSLVLLGLLSCHGTAVWLSRVALSQFPALSATDLKSRHVQAIVILGGGLVPVAPEYGEPQPSNYTAGRLRYGAWLAKQTGLPVAFSGGIGWAASEVQHASEATIAARVMRQEYGVALRWNENLSRDTGANARLLTPVLQHDGVQRIALVTDTWHMERAVADFERAGLMVVPAPTGFVLPQQRDFLEWIPSGAGLMATQVILREKLALAMGKLAL